MRKLDYPSRATFDFPGLALGPAWNGRCAIADDVRRHLSILVSRPISAVMLSFAVLVLLIPVSANSTMAPEGARAGIRRNP